MNPNKDIEAKASELGIGISDIRDKKTGRLIVANRLPRVKYYTPDGRMVEKIPQQRERRDGVVYDVFLAEGFTLQPPLNPKPYCAGCNKWHNTQEEVIVCIAKQKKFVAQMERKANKEVRQNEAQKDKRIKELEAKVDKLIKLMEAKA